MKASDMAMNTVPMMMEEDKEEHGKIMEPGDLDGDCSKEAESERR